MNIRKPVVAGQFYGGSEKQCLGEISDCIGAYDVPGGLPERIVGGIVPHAGWLFSGDLAGLVFSAIKQANGEVDTFIIFGASHRYGGGEAVVYDKGGWATPLGVVDIDEELACKVASLNGAEANCNAHAGEHSIEVQVPFIQHLFSGAKIVPVIVPSMGFDMLLGGQVAEVIKQSDKRIVCIASSDLTHYGPRYGYCPQGIGADAIQWSKDVNDAEFINLALGLESEGLLRAALENSSACGPGAVSVLTGVVKGLGKSKGVLLAHTNSSEVMQKKFGESSEESVGYAAIIY
ncbi:MAG: AmmeMemoRadiSam system protein B [Planctomycetes bacterium]|nr:AmmeMemoRadiSam system protein B [Planctomycetota bacterium]